MSTHIHVHLSVGKTTDGIEAGQQAAEASSQKTTGERWVVKREPVAPKVRSQWRGEPAKAEQWQREWGGEENHRKCSTAAAAQILFKHLGKKRGAFLAAVQYADLEEMIRQLHDAHHADAPMKASAAVAKRRTGDLEDEPSLPFSD